MVPYYYGPTPTRVRLYDRRQRCGKDRALSLLLLLLLFTAIIDRAITADASVLLTAAT